MAGKFETWAKQWRISWNATNGAAWLGGVASLLGDRLVEQATYAVRQRLPEFAEAAIARAIATERGIEPGTALAPATIAEIARAAATVNRLRGTALGMLVALYYADLDALNAVIVQQNGRGHYLTSAPVLADLSEAALKLAQPSWYVNVTLAPGGPGGHAWWTFDANDAFCSRFAVIWGNPNTIDLTNAEVVARARRVVCSFKPAKSTCVRLYDVTSGLYWGKPGLVWGDASLVWGGAVTEATCTCT